MLTQIGVTWFAIEHQSFNLQKYNYIQQNTFDLTHICTNPVMVQICIITQNKILWNLKFLKYQESIKNILTISTGNVKTLKEILEKPVIQKSLTLFIKAKSFNTSKNNLCSCTLNPLKEIKENENSTRTLFLYHCFSLLTSLYHYVFQQMDDVFCMVPLLMLSFICLFRSKTSSHTSVLLPACNKILMLHDIGILFQGQQRRKLINNVNLMLRKQNFIRYLHQQAHSKLKEL